MVHLLSISNFKRYPPIQAVIWSMLVMVILELVCYTWLPRSSMELQFDELRLRVTNEPAPSMQILGDSVAAGGILTTKLPERIGEMRNDAIPGGGPAFTYFLLRQEIQAGHVPKSLAIGHSPHTFSGVRFPVLVGRFAYWKELPEIFWYTDSWRDFAYGILTRFSYILSFRDQFKNLLTSGDYRFFISKPASHQPEAERLQQYHTLEQSGQFRPKPLEDNVWDIYKGPFQVSALNDLYFRRTLDLANAHGIKVYWITMPVTERVYRYRSSLNYEKHFLEYLEQFEHNGKLEFWQRNFLVYDDDLFDDLSHLNMRGAIKFSSFLANQWNRFDQSSRTVQR